MEKVDVSSEASVAKFDQDLQILIERSEKVENETEKRNLNRFIAYMQEERERTLRLYEQNALNQYKGPSQGLANLKDSFSLYGEILRKKLQEYGL